MNLKGNPINDTWKDNAKAWREMYRQVRDKDTGETVKVESQFRRLAESDPVDPVNR